MSNSGSVRAGEVIAGKFQIERILGEGGMGFVVAARHLQLGQMVALKFIKEEVSSPEFKARFLREARNTVKLKSKHVSRVLDVGAIDDGGSPYMVMEYLEGTDLSELLQQRGPFSVADTAEYVIQACEAIAEAHGYGIVHRDLKPANLFLTRGTGGEAVVKVLDFGVSKVVDMDDDTSARDNDSVMTKATDLLGSPSYMAPEQVVSARDADAKSDVWSLGVIVFRLISGKAPFAGNSLGDLIQKIVHGPLPNLRDLRPDIPEGLEHVIWRCFERDRTKRPDAVELARLLAPYAGPNATPSLERIAILGPALVRPSANQSIPPQSIPPNPASKPSFSGPKNWSSPGASQSQAAHAPKKDMSGTSFFVWALLLAVVVGSLMVVAFKLAKMPSLGGNKPTPTFAPLPPAPAPEPALIPTPSTVQVQLPAQQPTPVPQPQPTPSAKPSAHATGTGKKPPGPTVRPPPGPSPPGPSPTPAPAPDSIPNSREN